jgi:hypothetical protein
MNSLQQHEISKKLPRTTSKIPSKTRPLKPIKLEPILHPPTPNASIARTKLNKHEPLLSKREKLARAAELRLEKQRQEQLILENSAAAANP